MSLNYPWEWDEFRLCYFFVTGVFQVQSMLGFTKYKHGATLLFRIVMLHLNQHLSRCIREFRNNGIYHHF